MLTLGTRRDLDTFVQQVETLRETSRRVAHMIKGARRGRVIGDEDEVAPCLFFHNFADPTLFVGREVALLFTGDTSGFELGLRFGETEARKGHGNR